VQFWVEYGATTAYGSETAPITLTMTAGETRSVSAEIEGLEPATTYHYRFCASDSQQGGTPGCGTDRRLTTQTFDCGETVTADVRLTAPMDCQNALGAGGWTIGADGVDINLSGYSFNGFPTAVGIRSEGFSDLTIRNGFMGGWFTTAIVGGGSRNRIVDVDGFRFSLGGGQDNEVRRTDGRFFLGATANLVFADNVLQAGFGAQSAPALAGSGLDGAQIVRNRVRGGALEPGIEVSGSGMRILDNEVTGGSEGGIVVLGGDASVIRGNRVFDATDDSGDGAPQFGDGIFVGPLATGTLLRGNVAGGNAGDGIEVRNASTRLRENQADSNGDLGIEAVAGVTDLGGNRASANGNSLQCLNVTCFP
jgi:Right handed beta helix region